MIMGPLGQVLKNKMNALIMPLILLIVKIIHVNVSKKL